MSPKELLYVEDALGHQMYLKEKCCQAKDSLQNAELKKFVGQLEKENQSLFDSFFTLV